MLTTARLRLRSWRNEDLEPFVALNADPRVREIFTSLQTDEESTDSMQYICDHFRHHGFGLWAVELIGAAPFIGLIGLSVPSFDATFMPCVELGYRLAFEYWGLGYAAEGARAAITFGFATVGLTEIVAMTAVGNERSRRVMERVGMTRNAAAFIVHVNRDRRPDKVAVLRAFLPGLLVAMERADDSCGMLGCGNLAKNARFPHSHSHYSFC